jgi:hypothetical protein
MAKNHEIALDNESMMNAWVTSFNELWKGTVNLYQASPAASDVPGDGETINSRAVQTSGVDMNSTLKNWQALSATMSTPMFMTSLFQGAIAVPEVLAQLANSSLTSFVEIQKEVLDQASRLGNVCEAYRFEDSDKNILRLWNDIYERELKPFFHIPQIGITRFYQEHWNEAVDKYNVFQNTMAEFLRLLIIPFHHSLTHLQEKIRDLAEAGNLPENSKDYYQMWIKILEGHFMTLFQEHEYVLTLSRTISALSEWVATRNAVLEEMIGMFPIAKRSELDELASEVHELKKQNRRLMKKIKQM